MIRILIIGGGYSANRFVESFIFRNDTQITLLGFGILGKTKELSQKYCLPLYNINDDIDYNAFDVIVFSVPFYARLDVLKLILSQQYTGAFIWEKPPAISIFDLKQIDILTSNNAFIVPFNRRYSGCYNFDFSSNEIVVSWPINNMGNIDYYIDLLPHAIDFLIMNLGDVVNAFNIYRLDEKDIWFLLNGKRVRISFVNSNDNYVYVNNTKIPWPNYVEGNNKMLDILLRQTKADRQRLFDSLYQNTMILEEIIEKRNEDIDNR